MHRTLRTRLRALALVTILTILIVPATTFAWSEHPLITYPVVTALPKVAGAPPVVAERIDTFLVAEGEKIEQLLAEEELWARSHLEWYPPLPETLRFKAAGDPSRILERFCHAIRINPRVRFPLYLQTIPGEPAAGRPSLRPQELSFLSDLSDWAETPFYAVKVGETVPAAAVVVSASDEPDLLGLDIGLFTDNATEFGKIYGLGAQPFGNPNLEYGSQAPFHMGFYHESDILYFFAGFLRKTLPEYRIHLYKRLAEFAFATGHPYWGWRFTGIGLHYLADLTQPYHATVLPGVSTAGALWINTIDMIGFHGPKNDAVQLVSNRHTAIEKFLQMILQRAYRQGDHRHLLRASLSSAPEGPPYSDDTPRRVVTRLANAKAEETDRIIEEGMPVKFVSDPAFELGTSKEREQVVEKTELEKGRGAVERLILLTRDLLAPFGTSGRAYIRAILEGGRGTQAPK